MSDFYTRIIDIVADWQKIVEDAPEGLVLPETMAVLKSVVGEIISVAEETNPGGYHTEVFSIVQH